MPEVRQDVQENAEEQVETGEVLTRADRAILDMAVESMKKTPERLQDSLHRLSTLAAALAGGGIVGLRDDLMMAGFRIGAILFLLLCVLAAVCGSVPVRKYVRLNSITECYSQAAGVIERKWLSLRIAIGFFFLAFLVAFIGLCVGPAPKLNP